MSFFYSERKTRINVGASRPQQSSRCSSPSVTKCKPCDELSPTWYAPVTGIARPRVPRDVRVAHCLRRPGGRVLIGVARSGGRALHVRICAFYALIFLFTRDAGLTSEVCTQKRLSLLHNVESNIVTQSTFVLFLRDRFRLVALTTPLVVERPTPRVRPFPSSPPDICARFRSDLVIV